jgi:hypothetical protein
LDNRVFNLELLTSLIRGKSIRTYRADHKLEFILSTLTRNRVGAELTEIALKHFHLIVAPDD